MQKFILYISFISLLPSALFCDGFPGLVLFSQSQGQGPSKTLLLNNFDQKVKIWDHTESAIGVPHLNTDGSIILQLKSSDHYFGNTRGPIDGGIEIIWKWHLWDHLIQDQDSSLNNYGIIKNHPELIDINIGSFTNPNEGDWLHTNSIAYHEQYDQIIFSSRHLCEIYIIDHSTTIAEASEHTGGNSNKGGDILYRWGNPINYGRGTINDQKLNAQHGAHWIPQGFPGSGNIIIIKCMYINF